MALSDYQRQFNGLTLGDGTVYNLTEESGLEGFVIRSGSRPLPREDGSIPGLHLVDSKTAILPVEIVGDPETVVAPAMQAAQQAFAPIREGTGQQKYIFKNPGQPESFVWARPIRFQRNRTIEGAGGVDGFQVALEIADPRLYSTELFSETVPLFGASGGGAEFPEEFPFEMSAAEQDLATLVNAGIGAAYPLVRFAHVSGTVSGVTLTNLTTGAVFASTATITAGQILTADFDALIRATGSSVVHIGGSSRYGTWTTPRDPWYLDPGSNSVKFEVTGGGEATCLVSWRSTS